MRAEGRLYKGCLYTGLIITPQGSKVLEFNCRFGDPELQPIVPLIESDMVPFLLGIAEGRLPEEGIKWSKGAAICVVMASGGYPGFYQTGFKIKGLEEVSKVKDVVVFHAGTKKENGIWKTAGGRVLGITAKGKDIPEARSRVYQAVAKISWEGEHHRTDIGQKAFKAGFQIKMGLRKSEPQKLKGGEKMEIGWFSSGRDQAAIELLRVVQKAIREGEIKARIKFVFSNREKEESRATHNFLDFAYHDAGLPIETFSSKKFKPELRQENLEKWRREYHVANIISGWFRPVTNFSSGPFATKWVLTSAELVVLRSRNLTKFPSLLKNRQCSVPSWKRRRRCR